MSIVYWTQNSTARFDSNYYYWDSCIQVTALAVANLLHTHAAESPALTQKHSLIVQDLLHIHGLDATVLTQVQTLTVEELSHAHALDSLLLTTSEGKAVIWNADLLQGQHVLWTLINRAQFRGFLIWQIALPSAGAPATLIVAELAHSHALDAFTISQKHSLTVADVAHAHALDATVLTQAHTLAIQALLHAHILDEPVVQTPAQLIVQELLHGHALDSYALTQKHYLDPDAIPGPETADIAVIDGENAGSDPWEFDSITEEAGNDLSLDANAALHESYGYKISFGGSNDSVYGSKSVSGHSDVYARYYIYLPSTSYPFKTLLSYQNWHSFRIEDATSGSYAVSVLARSYKWGCQIYRFYYRTNAGVSYVDNIGQAISTDTQHYIDVHYKIAGGTGKAELWFDGESIASASNLTNNNIVLTNANIGQYWGQDNPANGEYFYIDDYLLNTTGPIGEYSGSPGISDELSLAHSHALDALTLSLSVQLVVADLSHTQTVDNITLVQAHTLVVNDAAHSHKVGSLLLPQKHLLALQDLLHAHGLDSMTFTTAHGYVTVSFTGKSASITFTGHKASADFTGKSSDVDFTGG